MKIEIEGREPFHAMSEGTLADWQNIQQASRRFAKALPDRIIAHLNLLRGDKGGFAVDRADHSLQTATRAYQARRDEEYVVCTLLHDMGDTLGPYNHADVAAAILQPFVSEQNHWMVQHHAIFQGYHFFHYIGSDRNMREKFRGHAYFDYTEEFVRVFDQASFDPNFKSMPLEAFEPMLRRVLQNPKRSIHKTSAH